MDDCPPSTSCSIPPQCRTLPTATFLPLQSCNFPLAPVCLYSPSFPPTPPTFRLPSLLPPPRLTPEIKMSPELLLSVTLCFACMMFRVRDAREDIGDVNNSTVYEAHRPFTALFICMVLLTLALPQERY